MTTFPQKFNVPLTHLSRVFHLEYAVVVPLGTTAFHQHCMKSIILHGILFSPSPNIFVVCKALDIQLKALISNDVLDNKLTSSESIRRFLCFRTPSEMSANSVTKQVILFEIQSSFCWTLLKAFAAGLWELSSWHTISLCPRSGPDRWIQLFLLLVPFLVTPLSAYFSYLYRYFNSCHQRLKYYSDENTREGYIQRYHLLLLPFLGVLISSTIDN